MTLFPVKATEILAIEFLTKNDKKPAGAAVVELESFEGLEKAFEVDGREFGGMVIWAVKDKGKFCLKISFLLVLLDGIRTLSFLRSIGHKFNQRAPQPKYQVWSIIFFSDVKWRFSHVSLNQSKPLTWTWSTLHWN